ncbi:MAG TPA: GNAT family N-acetyltransferase [Thermoanaerobaculia bacterium]
MKELALVLPDIPLWIETRAVLLSGACGVFPGRRLEEGYAVRCDWSPLVCVVGWPGVSAVCAAVAEGARNVIAPLASMGNLKEVLPDWRVSTATLHLLGPSAPEFTSGDSEVRLIDPGEERLFATFPEDLKSELTGALRRGAPMAATQVDGEPAAVCYAAWETEGLWDVSIDTLEPFRRRGLAERAVAFLIARMRERGKEPVWGAEDDNIASLRLAARMGFVPVDRLAVFAAT